MENRTVVITFVSALLLALLVAALYLAFGERNIATPPPAAPTQR